MTSTLFVSWIRHHGRSAAIANKVGAHAKYVTGGTGPAVLRYARAAGQTLTVLRDQKDLTTVLLMLPPFPALLAAAVARRDIKIGGDLHSGVFNDRKWSWALQPTLAILKRRGIAIVTNEALAEVCRRRGVETVVLHDILEDFTGPLPTAPRGLRQASYVLFPVAYAADEPLDAVLEAASLLPEQVFVLTGNAPQNLRSTAPENVVFTGFVSNAEFEALLRCAGAIAALTTRENTMQRAGYEALSASLPLIVSPTAVLREYFGDAAAYAKPTAGSIREAVTEVMESRGAWISKMDSLKTLRQREQHSALEALEAWIVR